MATFLAEAYVPAPGSVQLRQVVARLRAAARELTGEGTPVRLLQTIFVPGDELCFHVFEGPSAAAVGEAGRRVGLDFDRVVEAAS